MVLLDNLATSPRGLQEIGRRHHLKNTNPIKFAQREFKRLYLNTDDDADDWMKSSSSKFVDLPPHVGSFAEDIRYKKLQPFIIGVTIEKN